MTGYGEGGYGGVTMTDADGWHTLDTARDQWVDAPYQDAILANLLEIAKEACLAFAPFTVSETILEAPARYRVAQLMQARNIWNASKVSPSGDLGDGTYVITPKPLDWMIKQVLRPKRAVPVMF